MVYLYCYVHWWMVASRMVLCQRISFEITKGIFVLKFSWAQDTTHIHSHFTLRYLLGNVLACL
jgi:hypothetical protein